ncbi:MAG: hypothetical protein KF690_07730 [Bacteroidetes bacterium]|nr:hypothetical protein [Bacteroidota bacterium]
MNAIRVFVATALWAGILAGSQVSYAQLIQDAIRYNQMNPIGTARSQAMGGAYTAVGADYTSATLNPAGLGVYRGSDIQLSPYFNVASSSADYLSGTSSDGRVMPGIGSLGFVFHKKVGEEGLKSWSIGFGYNQLGNYLRRASAQGRNNDNSMTQWMADQANGIPEADLQAGADYVFDAGDLPGLAFNTGSFNNIGGYNYPIFVINPLDASQNTYYGAFDVANIEQTVEYKERGRHNEWNLAWGGNFDDRFYFGAKLGINDLSFRQTRLIIEQDRYGMNSADANDRAILPVDEVRYSEDLRTRGVGINASLGFLYHPVSFFRFGVAFHTPSLLSMQDEYSRALMIRDDQGTESNKSSATSSFRYRMVLPYRLNGGAMLLMGKVGLLTADVEIADYRMTSFTATDAFDPSPSSTNQYYTDLNRAINNQFQLGINYRAGVEFRLSEVVYLRGGFAHYGAVRKDAYRTYTLPGGETKVLNGSQQFLTAGLGFRGEEGMYVNLAGIYRMQQDAQEVYPMATNSPILESKDNLFSILISWGVYFK